MSRDTCQLCGVRLLEGDAPDCNREFSFYLDVERPDKLRLHLRSPAHKQELDNLAEVAVQFIQGLPLRVRARPARHVTHVPASAILNDDCSEDRHMTSGGGW